MLVILLFLYYISGAKHAYDIYKYTKQACDPSVELSRYEMPKSALLLLAKHGAQFNLYMLDDHEAMYHT